MSDGSLVIILGLDSAQLLLQGPQRLHSMTSKTHFFLLLEPHSVALPQALGDPPVCCDRRCERLHSHTPRAKPKHTIFEGLQTFLFV